MTSDSPSQKPLDHGSQSQKKEPQQGRGGLLRFFRNLAFLARAVDEELKIQAQEQVNSFIKNDSKMKNIKQQFESDYKSTKKEFDKDYRNLRHKVNGAILTIATVTTIASLFASTIVSDILSLDVLKVNVADLKEDLQDLEDKLEKPL